MKLFQSLLLVGALAALSTPAVAQSGTLDQSVTQDNVFWNMGFFNDMQQDVRCGIDGTLQGFSIRMWTQNAAVGLPVAVFTGHPGPHLPSDTPAWSGTAFASQAGVREWVYVDCSSAGINLAANDVFTIRVGDAVNYTSGVDLTGNSGWPNAFYPEAFYEDLNFRTLDRLTFQTWMMPTPPLLTVTGACPGAVTFDVSNGTGNYYLIYGDAGSSTVRGVDLQIANPQLAATMAAQLNAVVPAAACGKTVQVVDMAYLVASTAIVL
jgi:hypothetical protein